MTQLGGVRGWLRLWQLDCGHRSGRVCRAKWSAVVRHGQPARQAHAHICRGNIYKCADFQICVADRKQHRAIEQVCKYEA